MARDGIEPPTITSPQNSSTFLDSVTITCMSTDNEGVEKVELWVNGVSTGVSDNTEPYSLVWNTITYDDCSYTIVVRSYDTSGNTTDSDPITLINYKTVELWGECYSIENTTELDFYNSGLTGEIPPEIGNLINLTTVTLHNSQFTGEIPPEIGNLTNLTILDLGENQLTGSIPPEIGNLTNLTNLDLGGNQLTGSIPPDIGSLVNLTSMDLDHNELTGEIPSEIGNLTNLTSLFLHNNQLTGEIPPEIGNLTNLEYLWLRDNQLTGEIPQEICNLINLFDVSQPYLKLDFNQLCPPYPSCVEDYVVGQDTTNCD